VGKKDFVRDRPFKQSCSEFVWSPPVKENRLIISNVFLDGAHGTIVPQKVHRHVETKIFHHSRYYSFPTPGIFHGNEFLAVRTVSILFEREALRGYVSIPARTNIKRASALKFP